MGDIVKIETKGVEEKHFTSREVKRKDSKTSDTSKAESVGERRQDEANEEKPWKEYTTMQKTKTICLVTLKVVGIFGFLYLFICSLELLSSAFTLLSGKSTGSLVNNDYISNPVVGLIVGILITVLVQSSSTSTSIIVSMVASGMLEVHDAIPMVMGCNIGTSVTNTIVSMTQVADREQFRLAFSGATVHDMFNWMTVFVLLPVEIITGMLEALTSAIVDSLVGSSGAEINFLETITDPFVSSIIELDEQVMECWGINQMQDVDSMIVQYCEWSEATVGSTAASPMTTRPSTTATSTTEVYEDCVVNSTWVGEEDSCSFLFYQTEMSDQSVGIILLVVSLVLLVGSLLCVVKLLNTMLKGSIAKIIRRVINADVPYVPWLTGYIAILIGAVLTFLVQSSSVFTSTLTPLVGLGIITVERAYPMTLGSNVGTTSTALLAALAATGAKTEAIQIALVHLFYNLLGILLWYPIPFMRLPLPMCKFLGNTTAKYRWFAVFYLIMVFLVFPLFIFALSLGPPALFWGILGPIIILALLILVINILQRKCPKILPSWLQTWDFLPLWMRSLEPYDKKFMALPCCRKCRELQNDEGLEQIKVDLDTNESDGVDNKSSDVVNDT